MGCISIDMIEKEHKKPGRPPLVGDTMQQIALRLPKVMIKALDEMADARLDRPDRSVLIRELLAEGLERRQR